MTGANTERSRYALKAVLQDFRAARELELANGVRVLRYDPSDETFPKEPGPGGAVAEFYALSEADNSVQDNQQAIEEILILLWLFKPGPVWIWLFLRADGNFGFGSATPLRPPPGVHPYELSDEECDRFEAFVAHFAEKVADLTKMNERYLSRALERFQTAATRDRDHLSLTDLVIALESLLVEKGSDLNYKLALRTALLTGTSDEQRLEVFGNMKKAYGFRSAYVHGEEVKVAKMGTLHEDVRRYFANAIVRFVDLPQDEPAGVNEDQRSRRFLDDLALRHEEDLTVVYPEWWRPL